MNSFAIAAVCLVAFAVFVGWLVISTRRQAAQAAAAAALAARNEAALSDYKRAEKIHEDADKAAASSAADRRSPDDRLRAHGKLRDG